MAWLFNNKQDPTDLIKQAEEAIVHFNAEVKKMEADKESLLRRQVEIWSVSTAESSQGLEEEYKKIAAGVAYDVKRLMCLQEHLQKIKLGIFHARNNDTAKLQSVLAVGDPCQMVSPNVPKVDFKPAPSS